MGLDIIFDNYAAGKQTFIIPMIFPDISVAESITTRIGYEGDMWELRVDLLSPGPAPLGNTNLPTLDYVRGQIQALQRMNPLQIAGGGDIVKLSILSTSLEDCHELGLFVRDHATKSQKSLLAVGMGALGQLSRITSPSSPVTHSLVPFASAPSQLIVDIPRLAWYGIHEECT
ncbi:hypothetical protein ANO11243_080570 [Dothideomycetidae sp. 11243]|nr:hypothetical protein ANO11243_080570 [fungal sp. No.11243]